MPNRDSDYMFAGLMTLSLIVIGVEAAKKKKKTQTHRHEKEEKKGNILACILGLVFFSSYFLRRRVRSLGRNIDRTIER